MHNKTLRNKAIYTKCDICEIWGKWAKMVYFVPFCAIIIGVKAIPRTPQRRYRTDSSGAKERQPDTIHSIHNRGKATRPHSIHKRHKEHSIHKIHKRPIPHIPYNHLTRNAGAHKTEAKSCGEKITIQKGESHHEHEN